MKLYSIITNRNLPFRLKVELIKEKVSDFPNEFSEFVAYKLPKRVVYWAFIRAGSATGSILPDEVVTDVTYVDVLDRLHKR